MPYIPYRILERTEIVQTPLTKTFAFSSDPTNLELLTPNRLRFEMREETRIDSSLSLFGFPIAWRTLIASSKSDRYFVDEQEKGPLAFWRHKHEFQALGKATVVRHKVEHL